MISLVLYGRNDSYGYNLHKRAAISLNCMAELLTADGDEIIFVDYNTPDDFPTFPEAIQDTLTAKAKSLLRILRVRPAQHERFQEKTHLVCLEPVARNVAIRRSNPENRWILSTNTDMVFVPRKGKSLSEIAEGLQDTYYHLPRFEVPETLWESADRMNPKDTIASFGSWGRKFHLNEIVYAQDESVRYDGPGDFQLILRADLWKIDGFDEAMLLGWHVDSNIAKRLSLLPRSIGDVVDDLYGYHCDHTRQVTPAHRARAASNDQKTFFENVSRAELAAQRDSWGLADESVEEIRLTGNRAYLAALSAAIESPLEEPTKIGYTGESYNHQDYTPDHVIPFLIDSLSSYPSDTVVAWMGAKRSMLHSFAAAWKAMGFRRSLLVFDNARWLGPQLPDQCSWTSWEAACERADILIFDWGKPDTESTAPWVFQKDPIIRDVSRGFRRAVRHERFRLSEQKEKPRRFIGINCINNAVEGIFNHHIGAALTPLATHIRQGFLSELITAEIVSLLYAGKAGQKFPDRIASLEGVSGYVFYGPYLDLDSSGYRLTLQFSDVRFMDDGARVLGLEITSNGRLIAYREITEHDLERQVVEFEFAVSREMTESHDWPLIEFRLMTPGSIAFNIRSVLLDETSAPVPETTTLESFDCAPLLTVGVAGRAVTSSNGRRRVHAEPGVSDLIVHGPNLWFPDGRYRVTFRFEIENMDAADEITAYVTTDLGRRVLASISPNQMPGTQESSVEFTLKGELPSQDTGLLEFPVWSHGGARFSLTSVRIDPLELTATEAQTGGVSASEEILHLTHIGRAGKSAPGKVHVLPGVNGVVFFGPYLNVTPDSYQLAIGFGEYGRRGENSNDCGLSIAAVTEGHILAAHDIAPSELAQKRADLRFDIADPKYGRRLEFVLRTTGHTKTVITSLVLAKNLSSEASAPSGDLQVLKFLEVGPAGEWRYLPDSSGRIAISHLLGVQGYVAYGPYLALEPGSYEVVFDLYVDASKTHVPVTLDVARSLGKDVLTKSVVLPDRLRWFARGWKSVTQALSFNVSEGRPSGDLYEFRTSAPKGAVFALVSVSVKKLKPTVQVREAAVGSSP